MTHIVYGIDDKYLPCLIISMFTALKRIDGPALVTVFTAGPEFDTSHIHVLASHFPDAVVEIRRFDTSPLAEYEKSELAARFPAASMLPLFLPWLVDGKCLFLDADTLILDDVAQLFQTELNGCLIGACRVYPAALTIQKVFCADPSILAILLRSRYRRKREEYRKSAERMGFTIQEMASKYFCSGVILFDTSAIRSADPDCNIVKMDGARDHGGQMADMDLLNKFFKDRVHYIDLKWDVPKDISSFNRIYASPDFWQEIRMATRNPSILHFSSIFRRKSWNRPWYRSRLRYRLYRKACQEICAQTGIDVQEMFEVRV